MDNGASFETPGVPGGVQISDERNIFDFSLCAYYLQLFLFNGEQMARNVDGSSRKPNLESQFLISFIDHRWRWCRIRYFEFRVCSSMYHDLKPFSFSSYYQFNKGLSLV